MKLINVIVLVACIVLAGCSTPYKAKGFRGGFDEVQLSPNMWRVSFKGNGYTGKDQVANLALLRSADLTLSNGFTHFAVIDDSQDVSYSTYTQPTTTNSTFTANTYGNSTYGSVNSTSYGGQTMIFSKPSASNTILMFKEEAGSQTMLYDAKFICSSLGYKYEAQCARTSNARSTPSITATYNTSGSIKKRWPDGRVYEGAFKNDLPNGNGVLSLANGDKYKGNFVGGLYDGTGTYTWSSGKEYIGEFTIGRSKGQGAIKFVNGDEYRGDVLDGKPHGRGSMKYWDNSIKKGTWQDGAFQTD